MDASLISYLGDNRFPRAIRNNNPGNIRISTKNLIGKLPKEQRTDRSFEQFEYFWQGIASMILIFDDYRHDGAKTIEKLIYRYAKPGALMQPYCEAVSVGSGIRPRQIIPWNWQTIYLITNEIARYENKGRNPMIMSDVFAYAWIQHQNNYYGR